MRFLLIICLSFSITMICTSWGFYAHKKINETAVFLLPADIAPFYKQHIKIITEKAVDADKRCYIDTVEPPRHYIDLDEFDEQDTIPIHWSKATELFTERKLMARGVIPWQITKSYQQLVNAFKNKNINLIIKYSADLGHYVADAHVPLHTTSNYNGQFSNQIGIHAFWETRLPEKFSSQYNFVIGKPYYVEDIASEAWKFVNSSHALVDSVLNLEKELALKFKNKNIRSYVLRNKVLTLNYSDEYAIAYHKALNGMVERRMRQSIYYVASLWYSAWIDAGQPSMRNTRLDQNLDHDNIDLNNRKQMGRQEWH